MLQYTVLHCFQNGNPVIALANLHPPTVPTGSDGAYDRNNYMYQTVGHHAIPPYEDAVDIRLHRQAIRGIAVCYADFSLPPCQNLPLTLMFSSGHQPTSVVVKKPMSQSLSTAATTKLSHNSTRGPGGCYQQHPQRAVWLLFISGFDLCWSNIVLQYLPLEESRGIPHQSTTSAQRGALPPKTSPLPHLRVTTKPMLPLLPRSRHPSRLSPLGRCSRDTARSLLSMSSRRPIQATPPTSSLSLSIPRILDRSVQHPSRRSPATTV